MTELPLVIIDVQRGGPSTGLPTKTEQADLLQAMFGRNGECPVAIVAPQSPADCFDMAFEAVRLAIALHDAGVPAVRRLPRQRRRAVADPERRRAAEDRRQAPDRAEQRRRTGGTKRRTARRQVPAVQARRAPGRGRGPSPARPGLEHRIGGIEKQDVTGNVSYDPANHEHMVRHAGAEDRQHRQRRFPTLEVNGPADGDLLVIGWGGTYGAIATAVRAVPAQGAEGGPGPPALPQPDAEEHRRRAEAVTRRSWSPS